MRAASRTETSSPFICVYGVACSRFAKILTLHDGGAPRRIDLGDAATARRMSHQELALALALGNALLELELSPSVVI